MAPVSSDHNVPDGNRPIDRRRVGALGHSQRLLISIVRSRWIAMFVVAFAVSWSFHIVDEKSRDRIERNQQIILCTMSRVAALQALGVRRIDVGPILQACEYQQGK